MHPWTIIRRTAPFLATLVFAGALVVVTAPLSRAANGDCGQPLSTGTSSTVGDALFVLRAATGTVTCELCVCDVNKSGTVNVADALVTLRKAVGIAGVAVNCSLCAGVTTTTISSDKPSTTTTSSTSTTTTIPVRCGSDADCAALPPAFRCNPNTGTCDKPCTKTAQCKDFYECNKTTHYCEEPALLF